MVWGKGMKEIDLKINGDIVGNDWKGRSMTGLESSAPRQEMSRRRTCGTAKGTSCR